ncbi:Phosphoribosylformimino-5-aminoimidazole carboxamide ribotide isomerase [hydrothermal vent metagenome]|uniref:1-(5-phosphoribosyl)-5-[(5-phosphoribosylamino)methylideneamino]imidazole-4-carboxamideisomerase n=1 Tax=hydrothermal vent metagenome TaxID=652676 RepID=A0A3B1BPY5_9ZZZZ
MIILPAIDLMGGAVVRLRKGEFNDKTVYSGDPGAFAKKWADMGAEGIHIVDLDGARAGKPVNREAIRAITKMVNVPVEIGGGIRSLETAREYFDLGVSSVILGTSAIKNPDLVLEVAGIYPGRVLVGIDVKANKPAIDGWEKTVDADPVVLAAKFADMGAAGIIYTDISRDGMLEGPNIDGLKAFAEATSLPVTASGGVTTVDDVRDISKLKEHGVTSMIIGKALYDGAIDLEDALLALKNDN